MVNNINNPNYTKLKNFDSFQQHLPTYTISLFYNQWRYRSNIIFDHDVPTYNIIMFYLRFTPLLFFSCHNIIYIIYIFIFWRYNSTRARIMTWYNITSYNIFLYCVYSAVVISMVYNIFLFCIRPAIFHFFPEFSSSIGPMRDRFWAPNTDLKRTTLSYL